MPSCDSVCHAAPPHRATGTANRHLRRFPHCWAWRFAVRNYGAFSILWQAVAAPTFVICSLLAASASLQPGFLPTQRLRWLTTGMVRTRRTGGVGRRSRSAYTGIGRRRLLEILLYPALLFILLPVCRLLYSGAVMVLLDGGSGFWCLLSTAWDSSSNVPSLLFGNSCSAVLCCWRGMFYLRSNGRNLSLSRSIRCPLPLCILMPFEVHMLLSLPPLHGVAPCGGFLFLKRAKKKKTQHAITFPCSHERGRLNMHATILCCYCGFAGQPGCAGGRTISLYV